MGIFGFGKIKPGLYKAKFAKNTIIETFPEYNERGDIRFSLKVGGNLSEGPDGTGLMGLMPDVPGKKRFYAKKELSHYFSLVTK